MTRKLYYDRRRAQGLCVDCSAHSGDFARCPRCLQMRAIAKRSAGERNSVRSWHPGMTRGGGVINTLFCGPDRPIRTLFRAMSWRAPSAAASACDSGESVFALHKRHYANSSPLETAGAGRRAGADRAASRRPTGRSADASAILTDRVAAARPGRVTIP